jgi:hypothetical protein
MPRPMGRVVELPCGLGRRGDTILGGPSGKRKAGDFDESH